MHIIRSPYHFVSRVAAADSALTRSQHNYPNSCLTLPNRKLENSIGQSDSPEIKNPSNADPAQVRRHNDRSDPAECARGGSENPGTSAGALRHGMCGCTDPAGNSSHVNACDLQGFILARAIESHLPRRLNMNIQHRQRLAQISQIKSRARFDLI
jgi:hypothetical protein